jgi:predicted helicase
MNPYKDIVSNISPLEFEKFCFTVIKKYAESEGLNDFNIVHNKKMKVNGEEYQIDILAEFIALSVKFIAIIECKRQNRPVERDEVTILVDKVHRLAAHKGILISTSGFQSGALKKANDSGIALLQIIDKQVMHIRASIQPEQDERYNEFIKKLPPYYALQYSGAIPDFPDKKIYPTESMELELIQRIKKGDY